MAVGDLAGAFAAGRAAGALDCATRPAGAGSVPWPPAAGLDAGGRAGVLSGHRQSGPRCAVAHPLRRAAGADRRNRRGIGHLSDRGDAGPDGGLSARLGGCGHQPCHRHLDGLSAGAVFHPADRGHGAGPCVDHPGHRGDRLDALCPRGPGRGHGAGRDGLCLQNVKAISWLALTGLLMPIGILTEVYFGLPPALVLIGAIAMTASVIWLGVAFLKMKTIN